MILNIFLAFCLFVSVSHGESVVDFCVANLNYPKGPAGYPCKDRTNVTVDDFVFSGLSVPGNASNPFKLGLTSAIDATFPGLNGLDLAMGRLDIGAGGVVPLHSHRVSELSIVLEGTIISGFIGADNTPYYKKLNKWDTIIVPRNLLHFIVNVGDAPALVLASLNSANPGLQVFDTALFGNTLPSSIVEKITLIDEEQVKKLKGMFGGSN